MCSYSWGLSEQICATYGLLCTLTSTPVINQRSIKEAYRTVTWDRQFPKHTLLIFFFSFLFVSCWFLMVFLFVFFAFSSFAKKHLWQYHTKLKTSLTLITKEFFTHGISRDTSGDEEDLHAISSEALCHAWLWPISQGSHKQLLISSRLSPLVTQVGLWNKVIARNVTASFGISAVQGAMQFYTQQKKNSTIKFKNCILWILPGFPFAESTHTCT